MTAGRATTMTTDSRKKNINVILSDVKGTSLLALPLVHSTFGHEHVSFDIREAEMLGGQAAGYGMD